MKRTIDIESLRIPADYPAPRDILRRHFPVIAKELTIRGGWGYSADDACVVLDFDKEINPTQHFDGISIEEIFIHYRLREETEYAHEAKYAGMKWNRLEHRLVAGFGGVPYDVETVNVQMFTPEDWAFLKNDWEEHGGYQDDEIGKNRHIQLYEDRAIRFTEVFWFDVTHIL